MNALALASFLRRRRSFFVSFLRLVEGSVFDLARGLLDAVGFGALAAPGLAAVLASPMALRLTSTAAPLKSQACPRLAM